MKVKITLGIGLVGCTREGNIEIDDEDLDGLSEHQRDKFIDEEVQDWVANHIDVSWDAVT